MFGMFEKITWLTFFAFDFAGALDEVVCCPTAYVLFCCVCFDGLFHVMGGKMHYFLITIHVAVLCYTAGYKEF